MTFFFKRFFNYFYFFIFPDMKFFIKNFFPNVVVGNSVGYGGNGGKLGKKSCFTCGKLFGVTCGLFCEYGFGMRFY